MQKSTIYILHFNDVYDIEEQLHEPKGGAARFLYVMNQLKQNLPNSLTLFSGDVFSPSSLTHIYHGSHIIYPLQQFKIDVACLGNHDFDFPLDQLEDLLQQSNTTWILSNVYDKFTQKPLANVLPYKIQSFGNYKIGFIGLAEEEWLGLITDIPATQIEYRNFIDAANELCKYLRNELECNFIIALTHMRIPNDQILINTIEEGLIDLVLGGHDHLWHHEQIKQTFYCKSGTNFRNIGLIKVSPKDNDDLFLPQTLNLQFEVPQPIQYQLQKFNISYYPININSQIPVDPIMDEFVQQKIKVYNEKTQKTIGFIANDLEARFMIVRSVETTTANLFSDIIRLEFQTDIAILNCGTVRADEYFSSGPITYQTLDKLFAIPDNLVSFRISGEQLLNVLEISVSKLPSTDGRFLGVSGMKFEYSLKKNPMNRISAVTINNEPLDLQKIYTCATKQFIAEGGDGYPIQTQFLIDKTLGIQIKSVFVQFFEGIRKLKVKINTLEDLEQTKYKRYLSIISGLTEYQGDKYITVNPQIEGRIKVFN
ncbi:unnamed protein product [Paramecium pentaurelia]|uniref:5'-nucleotidase n=1 Tax=Paramecium pentaurelia TaxID=43138 RepID=A0A8S1WQA4_9CILI|nr:unnamed protein product [Paramecium pentaurelia]